MKSISLFKFSGILLALFILGIVSCDKDDPIVEPDELVASFQFENSTDNFYEVSFSNFSKNADSYEWDFGDGGSSTEKDPVYVYSATGSFDVTLTAKRGSEEATQTKSVTIVDPNDVLGLLTGETSKTWYLQREGIALGIGPAVNDNQWWSFGGVTPLGDRPCILDDQYIFHRDGTFEFNSNNTIFIDSDANGGWLGSVEGCYNEDEPGIWMAATGEDVSAFANGGSYTFDFEPGESLTINGSGAYIGLANKTAGGDNYVPIDVKQYTVFKLVEGSVADSLVIALEGADFVWNFYLVSYKDPNDLPDLPSAEPKASFSFTKDGSTVTFNNTSTNSTGYSWDFGDGGMSTEENPVHTYASEGTFKVVLTATDNMGAMSTAEAEVIISSATYSPAVLSSVDGKAWLLDSIACFYVGPAAGSNEWWPGITEADLEPRACQLDDEFIFFDDGTYQYDSKGAVFAEDYMLGSFACLNDEDIMAPYDVLASGTHTFTATEGMDPDRPMITVKGEGAFLGFSKAINGDELDGTLAPPSEITYQVFEYSNAGGKETLTVTIDISEGQAGTGWWTIRLRAK